MLNFRAQGPDISKTREDKINKFVRTECTIRGRTEDGMQDMSEAFEEESLRFQQLYLVHRSLCCCGFSLWARLSRRLPGKEDELRR